MKHIRTAVIGKGRRLRVPEMVMDALALVDGDSICFEINDDNREVRIGRVALAQSRGR